MTGPATDALERVMARAMIYVRVSYLFFTAVYVVVSWDWFSASPSRLTAPVLVVAWGAVFISVARRGRLTRGLGVADGVTALISAAVIGSAGPPAGRGGGAFTWIFGRVMGGVIVVTWTLPWLVALAGVVAITSTFVVASVAASASLGGSLAAGFVLVGLHGVFAVASRMLRRGALAADQWLTDSRTAHLEEVVAEARARDQREQDRIVHDTILNTLTGLAWGGYADDADGVRLRCRRDLDVIEGLVSAARAATAGRVSDLASVVRDATAGGLQVQLTGTGIGSAPVARMPATLADAVREALSNVERHAGTGCARVDVSVTGEEILVLVSDDGVGFDRRRVGRDRLGISESIVGRMRDIGGTAHVRSALGLGTTVILWWRPGPIRAARPESADHLQRSYSSAVTKAAAAGVVCWQVILLVLLVGNLGVYAEPVVPIVAWLVMAAVVGLTAPSVYRDGRLGRGQVALVVGGLLAAVIGVGLQCPGMTAISVANWAGLLGMNGLMMLVVTTRRPREWIPAWLLLSAAVVATGLHQTHLTAANVLRFVIIVNSWWGLLIIVTSIVPALRATALTTARAADAEIELSTTRAAVEAINADRQARILHLVDTIQPLLQAIADGELIPSDESVRRRCAARAARLRRRLEGAARTKLSDLECTLDAAEERGIIVETQVAGSLDDAPPEVRAEIARTVAAVLDDVPSGRVKLTVLCVRDSGTVMLSTPDPPTAGGAERSYTDALFTDVVQEHADGRCCLELCWPRAGAELMLR